MSVAFERGMAGSELAARRWTDQERKQVIRAIEFCSENYRFFTSDAIWARLGPHFPVTKGLAGSLRSAVSRGLVSNTGRTQFSERGGEHDHSQRLAVWHGYGKVDF